MSLNDDFKKYKIVRDTLKDCDVNSFMSIVETTVQTYCDKHGLNPLDMYDNMRAVTALVHDIIGGNDNEE